jgi:RsiW-degrading membrane proteinase PrsW (M82 family)
MALKLKYETGVATSIQFVVITILNFIDGVFSSVSQCTNGAGSCLGNIILAMLYFLIISIWFGALWLLGFAAQDRRSKQIALFLMSGEGLVFLASVYNFTHHTASLINKATSLVDLVLSLWVAFLAFRIVRAKGGRIRPRRRIIHNDIDKP